MNSKEIRQSFIQYFESKQHRLVRSSSVVPLDDPTLLFTNAGMNQFKPIFLGDKSPDTTRVVNSQKCIRVSGKHNDLEEVGVDTFHHTFFEMLGNWSFGDYYKAEAIEWAWDLVTNVWKLDKNRLWATVYQEDDEAFELWTKVTDIDPRRVLRFGKKENFWEMGETGPCGPCSEIHYFIGEDPDEQSAAGVNVSDQYWELWNLVFIQNHRDSNGDLHNLPATHVDTGAGLERLVAVLQGKRSNYDTDLFQPVIRSIELISGQKYSVNPTPFRVIADHIRMLSFSIADGALPSNEGRGYVLRRILRRASRFGRILGLTEPFIYQLVDVVGEILGEVYPELLDKRVHIKNVIKAEEKSFNMTLDRGLGHFDRLVQNLSGKVIPGEEAFRLYDTYGFPLDLTELIAREKGLTVDSKGFETAMQDQKSMAKAAGRFKRDVSKIKWQLTSNGTDSTFLGYTTLSSDCRIRRWAIDGHHLLLVLDQTPFYAESGGQAGDTGTITGEGIDLQVMDTRKENEAFVHYCEGDFDERQVTGLVSATVDPVRRQATRCNHTATHLLHRALKNELGDHVHQAGSLVSPEHLRFDLTHFQKLTADELLRVERAVNLEILKNIPVSVTIQQFEEARKGGAEALFGEKYGDEVRVVGIGKYSRELCGGTHVERTGDIGFFKIIEESALASGIRRIVALTHSTAVDYIQNQIRILDELQAQFKCKADDLPERITALFARQKDLEKKLKQRPAARIGGKDIVKESTSIGNWKLVVQEIEPISAEELKSLGDEVIQVLGSGIAAIGMLDEQRPSILIVVTADLVAKGIQAGKIARSVGRIMGGGGGGKPHLAMAGGKTPDKFRTALTESAEIMKTCLKDLR